MEDVQDGKKVSVQDGVTEDLELIERLDIAHKSFAGLIYILADTGEHKIESVMATSTDAEQHVATITTVLATAVA